MNLKFSSFSKGYNVKDRNRNYLDVLKQNDFARQGRTLLYLNNLFITDRLTYKSNYRTSSRQQNTSTWSYGLQDTPATNEDVSSCCLSSSRVSFPCESYSSCSAFKMHASIKLKIFSFIANRQQHRLHFTDNTTQSIRSLH